jgi:hypothetical protein
MGWESWNQIFENALLVWVVTLCGWFIRTTTVEVWVT